MKKKKTLWLVAMNWRNTHFLSLIYRGLHITDTCRVGWVANQSVVGFFVKKFQRTDTVHFFEELKNIENRVAWFLAELSKAEKGVKKYKQNQRRTELNKGPA
jgi:hypothetical protein